MIVSMKKSSPLLLDYENRIIEIHKSLGIPSDYAIQYGLALQYEEANLVEIGEDIFCRSQKLSIKAANSWNAMKLQAEKDGVLLGMVSAFRSVNRQVEIIQKKLDQGLSISNILKVSAAPGYSEHHSGCALDISTSGCTPLSESFELTEAFRWLNKNAQTYLFRLSYPKGNSFGMLYEPWHWMYVSSD